jgi:hypothetical protein
MTIFSGCRCCIGRLQFLAGGFGTAAALRARVALAEAPMAPTTAQDDELPDDAPLLAHVKARAWPVDPQKGYLVKELKPNIFIITEGFYQSLFVITGKGVVRFDAPPSLAQHIVQAVADATKEPIEKLVYSHMHVDHIWCWLGTPTKSEDRDCGRGWRRPVSA